MTFTPVVSLEADESITWAYPITTSEAEREAAGAFYQWPNESVNTLSDDNSLLPLDTKFNMVAIDPSGSARTPRTPTAWTPSTYPIHISKAAVGTNGEKLATIPIGEALICPDDFAGSIAINTVAFTGSATYNIQKNNTTVGTIVFDTGAASEGTPNTSPLATSGTTVALAAGDWIDIEGPATADATGAKIGIMLLCYRSGTGEID